MIKRKVHNLFLTTVLAAAFSTACCTGIYAAEENLPDVEQTTSESSGNSHYLTAADGYEANGDYCFLFDELEMDAESTGQINGGTDVEVLEDGSAVFDFKGQYAQVFYKLPEGINSKRVSRIEFADADPADFSVKVLPAPGDDSLTSGVTYGNNALNISGLDFSFFAAMTTAEGGTYTSSKVIITLGEEPVTEDESRKVIKKLDELTLAESSGAVVEDGTVTFTAQYQSVFFMLPDDIEAGMISEIAVKEDADVYHYKVMSEAQYMDPAQKYGDGIIVSYGNPVLNFSDPEAKYLIIMCGDSEPFGSFSLSSEVVFSLSPSREIQADIPNLKDTVASADKGLGEDAFMGTCIGSGSMKDEKLTALVKKHFNAVTLENELKPDSLLSGMNQDLVEDPEFGLVPASLNFSRPDQMLDAILEWNQEEGVNIKVRGHVLTWHQQTPTWFFREGYQSDGAYVSQEEMTRRHEWYIKNVMDHYFSDTSGYKDLFYGFDVVNEACSDSTGTYRSEDENSEWALIYGTGSDEDAPDYILNAFRFANKYAPESLELYYNDYNDCQSGKVPAIEKLLLSVKKHETDETNPTRITAFGMQAHHGIDSPGKDQIMECAARYGAIVGKVQATELDVKASQGYDGSPAAKEEEYTKMGYRYKEIFEAYCEIDQLPDIDVNAFTVWGAADHVSWLNDANNAGGGTDGSQKQCPLLFDGNYQAKPAFWAIVDEEKLDPYIKSVVFSQKTGGDDPCRYARVYDFDQLHASFIPVWDEKGIMIKCIIDETVPVNRVDLYVNWDDEEDLAVDPLTLEENSTGDYIFETGKEDLAGKEISFDIVITLKDEANTKIAYNNHRLTHDKDSRFFAKGLMKSFMKVAKGSAEVDGIPDEAWSDADDVKLLVKTGDPEASADAKVLWDENRLYVLMDVKDANLDASSAQAHEQDSVEVFIDENNEKSSGYQDDDKQYRINYKGEPSFNGPACNRENMDFAVTETEKGYLVEAAFAWTEITPEAGQTIGLDLQINDGKDGVRIGILNWFDASGNGWSSPSVFGEAVLTE